jgi:hypothetical protein
MSHFIEESSLKKKSVNIYNKIKFVNYMTDKEIKRLNSKYCYLGLQIKQIVVDRYGNEIKEKKNSSKNLLGKKRDRKEYNSLDKFLSKYYGKEQYKILNNNFEKNKKLFEYNPEDKLCTKKCLSNLKENLNSIKIDCEYMANKNSKIETDEYKMNVLNYIARYKQYITKEQYNYLYNKWKNELLKIRGTDLFNFDKINKIENWKVSILKCFKSEISLYSVCNVYDGVICGKKFVKEKFNIIGFNSMDNKEKEKEKEEEKLNNSEDYDESSDSDISEKTFEGNIINS